MFVSGVLVLTVSNILVKAIGLLFKIPLHDYLGDEGMGYFNAAYTIYTWFYMVSTAGLPVAMGNAVESVKQQCAYVTATNDEDGVARAVRRFVLHEEQ